MHLDEGFTFICLTRGLDFAVSPHSLNPPLFGELLLLLLLTHSQFYSFPTTLMEKVRRMGQD